MEHSWQWVKPYVFNKNFVEQYQEKKFKIKKNTTIKFIILGFIWHLDGKYALLQFLNRGINCVIYPLSLFKKTLGKQFILKKLKTYTEVAHKQEQPINNMNAQPSDAKGQINI